MATTVTTARAQWSPAPARTPDTADGVDASTPLALLRELVDLQRQDVALLQQILAALEPHRRPSPVTRTDRAVLARLLPAVVGVYGGETFSARDLCEDDRPAVRLVVRGQSVKRLAKLLARADGLAIDGLTLQRMGLEYQVTTWRIVAC